MTRYLLLITFSIAIVILSFMMGTIFISPADVLNSIFSKSPDNILLLLNLRFERIVMAFFIGSSLSLSGLLFQAILKNPLADPFTIGVSSGAALGAAFSIVLGLSSFYITGSALIGSLVTVFFIYIISQKKQFDSSKMILSGISLSFVLWSSVLLMFALSPAQQVHKALLWLMGDLSIARYSMLYKCIPFLLIIFIITFFYNRHLNIISFGDDFAQSSGVSQKDIFSIFWLAAILSAISVSLAGVIGFVGLIIPHIIKSKFGINHKKTIPLSIVSGGLFLVLCDNISRSIAPPYEIPIGVITGFFGGIFFLFLMIKGSNK